MSPLPSCCHCPVALDYIFQMDEQVESGEDTKMITLWGKGQYNLFSQCMQQIDWSYELDNLLPDEQYNRFLQILRPMIDKFIPKVQLIEKSSSPWTKNPPRQLTRAKSLAWNDLKEKRRVHGRRDPRTVTAWEYFRAVNKEIKQFSSNSQKKY